MTKTTCDLCGKEVKKTHMNDQVPLMSFLRNGYDIEDICDKCLSDINNAEENGTMKVGILKAVTQFCTNVPQCTPSNEAILERASAFDLWTALSMKKEIEVIEGTYGVNGMRTITIAVTPQEENE
jgi:hypothetical protein